MGKLRSIDFMIVGPAQPTWDEVLAIIKASFVESLKKPLNKNQSYRITLEVVSARVSKKVPK